MDEGGSPAKSDYSLPIEVVTQANQNVYATEKEVEEVENEYLNWREALKGNDLGDQDFEYSLTQTAKTSPPPTQKARST